MHLPLLQEQYAWGFVSGRVSVLEGHLVPATLYATLLAQKRVDEMVRQLQGLSLDTTLPPGLNWNDWAKVLESYYTNLLLSLRKDSPHPGVADIFLLQSQYFNLKQAITGQSPPAFPCIVFSPRQLEQAGDGEFTALPEPARSAAAGGPSGGEALPLELALDMAWLRHLMMLAADLGAPLIAAYAERLVEARLVLLLARAKRLGLPLDLYVRAAHTLGKVSARVTPLAALRDLALWPAELGGNLGKILQEALDASELRQMPLFEQRVAEDLLRLALRGRMQTAGPERVFSYLASVQFELFNLKLLVTGRMKHVEAPVLRQEVRLAYA